jgi:hypothetical protein
VAKPVTNFLGVFAAGEIPFDFEHTFNDSAGAPIPLSGYTPTIEMEGPDGGGPYGAGTVSVTDATAGKVGYEWATADFQTVGKYQFLLWVDNGTYRLASDLIKYEVYDGPGATP